MFLSSLNLFNFVFKYSLFYYHYVNKFLSFNINVIVLNTWFYPFILFFRYNSLFFNNMLTDMNTFDYNKEVLLNNNKKITINCVIYNFFLYKYNLKINIFTFCSDFKKLNTISDLYQNSLWLERELSEMFNINFLNKLDSRNLLLDYSYIGSPLLKSFPNVGHLELYYNYVENWIFYTGIILKESSKTEFYYY